MQAEPRFPHGQCSPHHLPAAGRGAGAGERRACARGPWCAQKMPLSSCLGKASNQEGSLDFPLSWAGRGAATDRRPDAGLGRLGQTSGGVLTKAGPLGLPGVLPCNPSQVSAAPFLLLVPSAGHSGANQGILDLGPPRA